ncbi:MAG TPA: NUDIX hydrolase [Pirellulales bacterium]|nr:NUDIX hydrolase [Pirellulales bacterium]
MPYRAHHGALEFCLITSLNKGRWGFPKGTIDPGETYLGTASKEAYEEAGLRGEIVDEPLGQYDYAKWGASLRVTVVLMRVTESHDRWLEAGLRQRAWCTAEEAQRRVANSDQRRLLQAAIRRLAAQNGGSSIGPLGVGPCGSEG